MSAANAEQARMIAQSTELIDELMPILEGHEARVVAAAFATVIAFHIKQTARTEADKAEALKMMIASLTAAVYGRAHTS